MGRRNKPKSGTPPVHTRTEESTSASTPVPPTPTPPELPPKPEWYSTPPYLSTEELEERFKTIKELIEILPYLLGSSITIFSLNWLYNKYNKGLFNFLHSSLTKSLNLIQYLLNGLSFLLYYLTILVIILIFIAGSLTYLSYKFHTSAKTREILLPIYNRILEPTYIYLSNNPTTFNILLSTICHSPLLILYRFLPNYLNYPIYSYTLFRFLGQTYFHWTEFETLVVIPLGIILILVLGAKIFTKKLGLWNWFENKQERESRLDREKEEEKMREMERRREEIRIMREREEKERMDLEEEEEESEETDDDDDDDGDENGTEEEEQDFPTYSEAKYKAYKKEASEQIRTLRKEQAMYASNLEDLN